MCQSSPESCAGVLERPAKLHRLAESIPEILKSLKIPSLLNKEMAPTTWVSIEGNKDTKRTGAERRDEKKRDRKGKSKWRPMNVEVTENKEEQKQRGEGGIRGQGSEQTRGGGKDRKGRRERQAGDRDREGHTSKRAETGMRPRQ
jgi:hypothetical protein